MTKPTRKPNRSMMYDCPHCGTRTKHNTLKKPKRRIGPKLAILELSRPYFHTRRCEECGRNEFSYADVSFADLIKLNRAIDGLKAENERLKGFVSETHLRSGKILRDLKRA